MAITWHTLLLLAVVVACAHAQGAVTADSFRSIVHDEVEDAQTLTADQFDSLLAKISDLAEQNQAAIRDMVDTFDRHARERTRQIQFEVNQLVRDVEANHDAIVRLALAFAVTRISHLEAHLDDTEREMKAILTQVEAPFSSCGLLAECAKCVNARACVWCDAEDKCVSGSVQYGSDFFECAHTWLGAEDASDDQLDAARALCDNGRVKQAPASARATTPALQYTLNKRVDVHEREWVEDQQQRLISLSWRRQATRDRIRGLEEFYYRVKRAHARSLARRAHRDGEMGDATGFIYSLPEISPEEHAVLEGEYNAILTENGSGKAQVAQRKSGESTRAQRQESSQQKQQGENQQQEQQSAGEIASVYDDDQAQSAADESYDEDYSEYDASASTTAMTDAEVEAVLSSYEGEKEVQIDLDAIEDEEQAIIDYIAQDIQKESEQGEV